MRRMFLAQPVSLPSTPVAPTTGSSSSSPSVSAISLALASGPLTEKDEADFMEAFVQKHKKTDKPGLKMAELKAEREKLKIERRKVQKEMKNEIRKRQRLRSKAKKLSAEELVQVLSFRAQEEQKRVQKETSALKENSTGCKDPK